MVLPRTTWWTALGEQQIGDSVDIAVELRELLLEHVTVRIVGERPPAPNSAPAFHFVRNVSPSTTLRAATVSTGSPESSILFATSGATWRIGSMSDSACASWIPRSIR